jgi:hypothetical protein
VSQACPSLAQSSFTSGWAKEAMAHVTRTRIADLKKCIMQVIESRWGQKLYTVGDIDRLYTRSRVCLHMACHKLAKDTG